MVQHLFRPELNIRILFLMICAHAAPLDGGELILFQFTVRRSTMAIDGTVHKLNEVGLGAQ